MDRSTLFYAVFGAAVIAVPAIFTERLLRGRVPDWLRIALGLVVAAATGLTRSKNQGVLNIAVLKAGKPGMAVVSGTVKDLTGRSSPLSFKQITDQGAVYYIAQFKIDQAETLTFDLNVETGGVSHKLSFNQEVFPGE